MKAYLQNVKLKFSMRTNCRYSYLIYSFCSLHHPLRSISCSRHRTAKIDGSSSFDLYNSLQLV